MQQPGIIVLAAGMGSRYGGLKQLEAMGPNGETLLDYSIYDAMQAGFKRIVFIIRRDIEMPFRNTIGSRYENKIEIDYAFQSVDDIPEGFSAAHRTKPWGTAHALWAARNSVRGPFAVINADDFYGREAYFLLAQYFEDCKRTEKQPLCMVAYQLIQTLSRHGEVNRGLCRTKNGLLESVEEITGISASPGGIISGSNSKGDVIPLPQDALVSMNFWGFSDSIFSLLHAGMVEFLKNHGTSEKAEYYIPSFIDDLIRENQMQCHVLQTTNTWFGVTYPADKPIVQEQIRALIDAGSYPSPLMD